jgi:hypothetical protein
MSLTEMMIAAAILSMILTALMVGISTLQRTFRASQYQAKSQIEQARIIDYIGRDVRRAKTVTVDTYQQGERLNLTIPDYYQSGPKLSYDIKDIPRTPYLHQNKEVRYSDNDVAVAYYRRGTVIYRNVNGAETPLATEVESLNLGLASAASASQVMIKVKFRPRYSFNAETVAAGDETAAEAVVFLRNITR